MSKYKCSKCGHTFYNSGRPSACPNCRRISRNDSSSYSSSGSSDSMDLATFMLLDSMSSSYDSCSSSSSYDSGSSYSSSSSYDSSSSYNSGSSSCGCGD